MTMFGKIKFAAIFVASTAGILWVVNLPYPMIRQPVAQAAPLLLLPSFMSMDRHYRGAIDSLEQADQLISKATSSADIERGGEKVKEAKKHLENLPVWFLGYYPQRYCSLVGCSWQFTFDEFEKARQRVARLEAVAFQDKNALVPLNEAQKALLTAKQEYQQAKNTKDREKAIASWQIAIDKLDQISQQTFAGKNAQTQLTAYKRDFENAQVGNFIAAAQEFDLEAEKVKLTKSEAASELWQQAITRLERVPNENPRYLDAQKLMAAYQVKQKTVIDPRSSTLIEAGKQYALAAAKASQNPPHTSQKWEQIGELWEKAIQQLEKIQVSEPSYVEAQKLIAQYQTNVGTIKNRRQMESDAVDILKEANKEIQRLIASPPTDKNQIRAEIQGVITQLNNVKSGTTAYTESQRLLTLANKRIQQLK
jgi:tetratricopeptide (TPR) repeat protein